MISFGAVVLTGLVVWGLASRDDDGSNATVAASPSTDLSESSDSRFTGQELATRFGDAVYRIDTDGCGYTGRGSGFALDRRHIVTNYHIVANDTSPRITARDRTTVSGHVIGWSEDPDLAVIRTDQPLGRQLRWADTQELAEGEQLVVLGYPVPSGDFSVVAGSIVSFQQRGSLREAIRTDAALDYGYSGGPGLTPNGAVAGVATRLAPSEGIQYVPLLFTADSLERAVENIIANAQAVTPDCSRAGSVGGETDGEVYDPLPAYGTWTVILASKPTASVPIEEAERLARDFETAGVDASLLLSDLYPSLNPGYWVVYSGVFVAEEPARQHCLAIKPLSPDCYQRYLGE